VGDTAPECGVVDRDRASTTAASAARRVASNVGAAVCVDAVERAEHGAQRERRADEHRRALGRRHDAADLRAVYGAFGRTATRSPQAALANRYRKSVGE
jgi:hypothetical protein